jgi:hypothetical protein
LCFNTKEREEGKGSAGIKARKCKREKGWNDVNVGKG